MHILEVNTVSKALNKKPIIKDISFNIEEGEIVGFVGPNGAGKTTTLRMIANLIYPDKGSIYINGYNLLSKEREKALNEISAIIENPGLYRDLTGKQNLEYIRKLRKISVEDMNSIVEFTGLKDRINDRVYKYSLGMKQRLALGMCLLSKPKLLLLDEPTNGLDPTGTLELRALLLKLCNQNKISILISSHILSEIDKICTKIIYIKDGQIISIENNSINENKYMYKIELDLKEDIDNIKKILLNCNNVKDVSILNKSELIIHSTSSNLNQIMKVLVLNNICFTNIELVQSTAEDKYKQIFS